MSMSNTIKEKQRVIFISSYTFLPGQYLTNEEICDTEEWKCHDGSKCITKNHVCDIIIHCTDGSDENPEVCVDWPCPNGTWKCNDSSCISESNVCDGWRMGRFLTIIVTHLDLTNMTANVKMVLMKKLICVHLGIAVSTNGNAITMYVKKEQMSVMVNWIVLEMDLMSLENYVLIGNVVRTCGNVKIIVNALRVAMYVVVIVIIMIKDVMMDQMRILRCVVTGNVLQEDGNVMIVV